MANEIEALLGIPSEEAEAVRRILQPAEAPARPVYADPYQQAYSDYGRNLNAKEDAREANEMALETQATIQRRMRLPTATGKQARTMAFQKAMEAAVYEKQAKALMDDLSKIDAADPEALSHQDEVIGRHSIARQALSDPRISGLIKRQAHENEEMNTLFDKDALARQDYADLRAAGDDPKVAKEKVKSLAQQRADRVWFASGGGDPAEIDNGTFTGADGRFDRAKAAFHLSQKKKPPTQQLGALEARQLDTAAKEVAQISDDRKIDAYETAKGKKPETKEEWDEAWTLANDALAPDREALAAIVQDLEDQGKIVPNRYKEMAGLSDKNTNVPQKKEERSTESAPAPASSPSKPGVSPLDQVRKNLNRP